MVLSTNLSQHLRTHEHQRMHLCRFCHHSATTKDSIARHENNKHWRRKYRCLIDNCTKVYSCSTTGG